MGRGRLLDLLLLLRSLLLLLAGLLPLLRLPLLGFDALYDFEGILSDDLGVLARLFDHGEWREVWVGEEGVVQELGSGGPLLRVPSQHLLNEVEGGRGGVGELEAVWLGEQDGLELLELLELGGAGGERLVQVELGHDAAQGEDVDLVVVGL